MGYEVKGALLETWAIIGGVRAGNIIILCVFYEDVTSFPLGNGFQGEAGREERENGDLAKLAKVRGLSILFQAEENSKYKDPEVGAAWMHLRRMSVVGTEWLGEGGR